LTFTHIATLLEAEDAPEMRTAPNQNTFWGHKGSIVACGLSSIAIATIATRHYHFLHVPLVINARCWVSSMWVCRQYTKSWVEQWDTCFYQP